MASLTFYATRSDVASVLDAVLATGCVAHPSQTWSPRVLEPYPDRDAILDDYDAHAREHGGGRLDLALYSFAMRGRFRIERHEAIDGPWYDRIVGWGLIRRNVQGVERGRLKTCWLVGPSARRARAWERTEPEWPPVDEWDFRECDRITRRIARRVRDVLAVRREGSRPVLPGAQALLDEGQVRLGLN